MFVGLSVDYLGCLSEHVVMELGRDSAKDGINTGVDLAVMGMNELALMRFGGFQEKVRSYLLLGLSCKIVEVDSNGLGLGFAVDCSFLDAVDAFISS